MNAVLSPVRMTVLYQHKHKPIHTHTRHKTNNQTKVDQMKKKQKEGMLDNFLFTKQLKTNSKQTTNGKKEQQ